MKKIELYPEEIATLLYFLKEEIADNEKLLKSEYLSAKTKTLIQSTINDRKSLQNKLENALKED